jgi:hypothetical protein
MTRMRLKRQFIRLAAILFLLFALAYSQTKPSGAQKPPYERENNMTSLSKIEFEIIEGIFHDGLGTFAELMLANKLSELAQLDQSQFNLSNSEAKMRDAMNRLPDAHKSRAIFEREKGNVIAGIGRGAIELLNKIMHATLIRVRHVAREFAGAKAADLLLEFRDHPSLSISVKTDKSGKVAIAEGQTPDVGKKWAERYFQVSPPELEGMIRELGFSSMNELKSHYLNVSRLVAHILIRKLGLVNCQPADFSQARVTNLESDGSQVIIFDRATGEVKWESLLDAVDIDRLTSERISLRPSRPRGERLIGSEYGIKIDGRAVVTFQIKHKRGAARETNRRNEFSDITTRLVI